jgi:hypothetical protein
MDIQDFGIWFLLLSLFLPRVTLFFWWICGNLPHNTTPFVADFFASIFLPRILILVWIYQSMGICAWFWIHLVVMLFVWVFNAIRLAVQIDKK